ncbi:MAG: hypothetical protein R3Y57_07505, partial [Erysipelotrichaceae bacterium]
GIIALSTALISYQVWGMLEAYMSISTIHFVLGCMVLGIFVTVLTTTIYVIAFKSFRNLIRRFYNLIFVRDRG